MSGAATSGRPASVPIATIAREWTRIGLTGFGGPPTHIALLRRLVVEDRGWLSDADVEAAIAACNLLPGPASTQLAIYLARRLSGVRGAVAGGLGFIVPGVVIVTALSVVFLAQAPPRWVRGPAPVRAQRSPRSPSTPAGDCSGRAGDGRGPFAASERGGSSTRCSAPRRRP